MSKKGSKRWKQAQRDAASRRIERKSNVVKYDGDWRNVFSRSRNRMMEQFPAINWEGPLPHQKPDRSRLGT